MSRQIRTVRRSARGEWDAVGGPYLIEETAIVPSGSSLRIGPGVQVVLAAGAIFEVRGSLEIAGERLAPVVFRPASIRSEWGGLRLHGGGARRGEARHLLRHCRFEGGRERVDKKLDAPALLDSALIIAEATSVRLESCVIRGVNRRAFTARESTVAVEGLRIVDGGAGILVEGGSFEGRGSEVSPFEARRLWGDGLVLR